MFILYRGLTWLNPYYFVFNPHQFVEWFVTNKRTKMRIYNTRNEGRRFYSRCDNYDFISLIGVYNIFDFCCTVLHDRFFFSFNLFDYIFCHTFSLIIFFEVNNNSSRAPNKTYIYILTILNAIFFLNEWLLDTSFNFYSHIILNYYQTHY